MGFWWLWTHISTQNPLPINWHASMVLHTYIFIQISVCALRHIFISLLINSWILICMQKFKSWENKFLFYHSQLSHNEILEIKSPNFLFAASIMEMLYICYVMEMYKAFACYWYLVRHFSPIFKNFTLIIFNLYIDWKSK